MSVTLKVAKSATVRIAGKLLVKDDEITLQDDAVTENVEQLVSLGYLTIESGALPSAAEAASALDTDEIGKALMDYVKSKASQVAFADKESGGFFSVEGTVFVGQVEVEDLDDAFVPFLQGGVTIAVQSGDVVVDTSQPVVLQNGVATFQATISAGVGVDVILELSSPTGDVSGLAVTDTLTLRRAS